MTVWMFGADTPDSLRSLGVAPGGGVDAQDGDGGHAAFAEVRGGNLGIGEEEFAQDGEGFDARVFEEGFE